MHCTWSDRAAIWSRRQWYEGDGCCVRTQGGYNVLAVASLQLRMQDGQRTILGITPGSFISHNVPSGAERW